jgi:hypothetical protein
MDGRIVGLTATVALIVLGFVALGLFASLPGLLIAGFIAAVTGSGVGAVAASALGGPEVMPHDAWRVGFSYRSWLRSRSSSALGSLNAFRRAYNVPALEVRIWAGPERESVLMASQRRYTSRCASLLERLACPRHPVSRPPPVSNPPRQTGTFA